MYRSYVMGVGASVMALKDQDFFIEPDGENYMVSFSEDKAPVWESFIIEHLAEGYWNEYLAGDRAVFLFCLQDGVRKYKADNFQNDEVLAICEELCECRFGSLKEMLAGNHFYKPYIQ